MPNKENHKRIYNCFISSLKSNFNRKNKKGFLFPSLIVFALKKINLLVQNNLKKNIKFSKYKINKNPSSVFMDIIF